MPRRSAGSAPPLREAERACSTAVRCSYVWIEHRAQEAVAIAAQMRCTLHAGQARQQHTHRHTDTDTSALLLAEQFFWGRGGGTFCFPENNPIKGKITPSPRLLCGRPLQPNIYFTSLCRVLDFVYLNNRMRMHDIRIGSTPYTLAPSIPMQNFDRFVAEKSALLSQLDELKHGVKEFDEAVKKSARSDARRDAARVRRAAAFTADYIDIASYVEATKKMKAAFRCGFAAKLRTKKVYSSLLLKLACLLDELSHGTDELGISLAQANASFHEELAEQATYFEHMIDAADKLQIASFATHDSDSTCSVLGSITIRESPVEDAHREEVSYTSTNSEYILVLPRMSTTTLHAVALLKLSRLPRKYI